MPTTQAQHDASAQAPGSPWDSFGPMYCISLVNRTDRQAQAKTQFSAVGLNGRVVFHRVNAHPTNNEQGIYESHMACLAAGLARTPEGTRCITVFEDDILFKRFSPKRVAQVQAFIEQREPADWDILFLGGWVKSSKRSGFPGIRQIRYQCAAHGYVISIPFARKLLATPWAGKAYDDMLRDMTGTRFYKLYPTMAFQSSSASDNDKTRALDRTRRRLGGMALLQRINELFHRHMYDLIIGHTLFFIGIALLVYLFFLR